MKKKTIALIASCAMLFGVATGGTFAWLADQTEEVVNTFTAGDIDITLTETWNAKSDQNKTENDIWQGKMIPGSTLKKDPVVTVLEGSEACWLYIKIEKTGNVTVENDTNSPYEFDAFISYELANGWTKLSDDIPGVYFRGVSAVPVDKNDSTLGTSVGILKGDIVTVKDTVTKEMLNACTANGNTGPKLTFTAYAIQKEGFTNESSDAANAKTAWETQFPTHNY